MLIQLSFFAIRILSKHVHVNQLSRLNPGNYVIFATSIIFFISINNRYEIFVHLFFQTKDQTKEFPGFQVMQKYMILL